MDELKIITAFFIAFVCFVIALYPLSFVIGEEHIVEGTVIDSEYSQSGFGSADITVLYFEDNTTLILNSNVEIDRNKLLVITYWDSPIIEGHRFVNVKYNGELL